MASKVRRRAPAAVKGGGKSKTRGGGATSTVAGEESEPPIGTVFGCGLLATSALVFGLAVGLHANTLHHGFVFDDARGVVSNADVIEENPLSDVWRDDFWGKPMSRYQSHKSYRPFTVLSFRANHIFGKLDPIGYHAVNIVLHAFVCVLFLHTVTRVFGRLDLGFYAALLFVVHSIHTECVANIVGRAEILGGAFVLGSVLLYNRACGRGGKTTHFLPLLGSMGAAAAAMLSKEQGLMVLGVVAAFDVIVKCKLHPLDAPKGLVQIAALRHRVVVIVVTGMGLLAFRMWMMGGGEPIFNEYELPAIAHKDSLTRFLTFNYYAAFHLQLLVAPVLQSSDWSYGSIPLLTSFNDPRCIHILAAYFTVGFTLLGVLYMLPRATGRTESRPILAGVLTGLVWMGITFLPSSNLFFYVGFVVAERILYLPSMGYCIIVAGAFHWLLRRLPKISGAGFVLLLALLSQKTLERNIVWKSDFTLHEAGAALLPENVKMMTNYGMMLHDAANEEARPAEERKDFLKRAVDVYQQSLANIGEQHFPNLYFVYGNYLQEQGKVEEAKSMYQKGLEKRDKTGTTLSLLNNLGMINFKLKAHKESEDAFLNCLAISPTHASAINGLAVLYASTGQHSASEARFKEVVALMPEYTEAKFNYGTMLAGIDERLHDAKDMFNEVLAVNPAHSGATTNMKYVDFKIDQLNNAKG